MSNTKIESDGNPTMIVKIRKAMFIGKNKSLVNLLSHYSFLF